MKLTKLDNYEYTMLPGIIRISIDGANDPDLVDILSEISRSDGNIYLDGMYFKYLDRHEVTDTHIDLYVTDSSIML